MDQNKEKENKRLSTYYLPHISFIPSDRLQGAHSLEGHTLVPTDITLGGETDPRWRKTG